MFIFYNLNNIYLPLLSTKCSGSFPLNFSRFFHLDTLFPAGWFMNKIAKKHTCPCIPTRSISHKVMIYRTVHKNHSYNVRYDIQNLHSKVE